MSKFIELTIRDGRKILINVSAIELVTPYKGLTHISLHSSGCEEFDCIVQESYEEVKRLCQL